jgi:hypothetical protein
LTSKSKERETQAAGSLRGLGAQAFNSEDFVGLAF